MDTQTIELIRTSQSWDGVELPEYLKGKPELVVKKYIFPVGQKLDWHYHPVMNYGVLVEGELTIIAQDGTEKVVHEGEAVVEMVGTVHHGENRGTKPAVLYMFYLSQEGLPLSVPHSGMQTSSVPKTKDIYLAGGCFWGTEHYFKQIEGVVKTEVGFANGHTENPTYQEVYTDTTGFAETVHIQYNPDIVELEFLLQMFFKAIDPTSLNKQGHDEGTRYRTGIYYTDPEDLLIIERVYQNEQKNYPKPLVVEKLPLENFYMAEEYHQDYLDKNPSGYCHLPQSLFDFAKKAKDERKKRFNIRPAKPDEAGLVLDFIKKLAAYEKCADEVVADEATVYHSLFVEHSAEVVFAEEDGVVVGFALFFHNFSTFVGRKGLYLEDLFILPEKRGRGYGKALLKYLANLAVERHCGRMELICLDWNEPALKVYRSIGAVPMNEWTVQRLDEAALKQFADKEYNE